MLFPDYQKITDIRVRQAIGYAYPYQEAAKAIGHIVGVTALPGTSILPLGFPGRQGYDVLEPRPNHTDPDKARAMLREAGFAPGDYELEFSFGAQSAVPVELIVKSLEAAGFKATPRLVPGDALDTFNHDPDAPVNLRTGGGWCSDWPSGALFFRPLFQSDSADNFSQFAEPEIDAEIERIRQLPFEDQPAAWGALDKTIMTDHYPAIINYYQAVPKLHGSRIGGLNADDIYTMPTWKDLYVMQ